MRRILLVLVVVAAVAAIKRLPGLGNAADVGLGDVIKSATNAIGIQTCEGCARRAATLNRLFTFSNPLLLRLFLRQLFGRGLSYECTTSGSACLCKGVHDCLNLGQSKKCAGKRTLCGMGVCVCY